MNILPVCIIWLLVGNVQESMGQMTASEVIEEIRSAYERVDYEVAENRINEALNQFEKFSPNELSQIYVFSALVSYAKDDRSAAESDLLLAFQLNSELELDPIIAPPGLVEIADRLKILMIETGSTGETKSEVRYLVVPDSRPGAALRSMVLPGWGQLYKGDKTKGIRIMGAWGITAGSTLTAHILRSNAENKYLDAATSEEAISLYGDFDRWHQIRNNLFWAATGVWVYSYIDALVFKSSPENQKIQVYAAPGYSGPRMHVIVRF